MIQLFINGQEIGLSGDDSFNFHWDNPFFEPDDICTPYTTPLEIPLTDGNRRALNFPDRICNASRTMVYDRCMLLIDGRPLPVDRFVVDEVTEDTVIGSFQGLGMDELKRPMSTLPLERYLLGKTTASRYVFDSAGEVRNVNDNELAECYRQMAALLRGPGLPFVVSPIRITSNLYRAGNDSGVNPYCNIRSMYLNPVWYSQGEGCVPEVTINGEPVTGSIVPGIRLPYLLEKIFGGRLKNNLFNSDELSKLVVQAIYHEELSRAWLYGLNLERDVPEDDDLPDGMDKIKYDSYYNVAKFLPNVACSDFIKELCKVFCVSVFSDREGFTMRFNRDIIRQDETVDITPFISKVVSITSEDGKFYKYGYDRSRTECIEEGYERVSNIREAYASQAGALELRYGNSNINQICRRTGVEQTTAKYEYIVEKDGFGSVAEKQDERETFDMTSRLVPMNNSIHNTWTGPYRPSDWPADRTEGNTPYAYESLYTPELDQVGAADDFPHLMIDHGTSTGLMKGWKYPFLSAKNYDHFGRKLGNLTLDMDKKDGLFQTYHKEYAAFWAQKRLVVTVEAILDSGRLMQLKPYTPVYYQGKRYLIRSLDANIYADYLDPVTLELVCAPVLSHG